MLDMPFVAIECAYRPLIVVLVVASLVAGYLAKREEVHPLLKHESWQVTWAMPCQVGIWAKWQKQVVGVVMVVGLDQVRLEEADLVWLGKVDLVKLVEVDLV